MLRVEKINNKTEADVIRMVQRGELNTSSAERKIAALRRDGPTNFSQERIDELALRNKEITKELNEGKQKLKELFNENKEVRVGTLTKSNSSSTDAQPEYVTWKKT